MSIARYRKKPVEIDAMKFEYTSKCLGELKEWMGNSFGHCIKNRYPNASAELSIMTLEDGGNLKAAHIATEGDYIIKGVHGAFYTCKPDIFELTYEQV